MSIDAILEHRRQAEVHLESLLGAAGFRLDRPEPILAWIAFCQFVAEPLPGLADVTLGYECRHSDVDDRLWLSFTRSIMVIDDPHGVGCPVELILSADLPADLDQIEENYWHWEEHETLAEWVAIVEAFPGFWRCLAVEGWRWVGFG